MSAVLNDHALSNTSEHHFNIAVTRNNQTSSVLTQSMLWHFFNFSLTFLSCLRCSGSLAHSISLPYAQGLTWSSACTMAPSETWPSWRARRAGGPSWSVPEPGTATFIPLTARGARVCTRSVAILVRALHNLGLNCPILIRTVYVSQWDCCTIMQQYTVALCIITSEINGRNVDDVYSCRVRGREACNMFDMLPS